MKGVNVTVLDNLSRIGSAQSLDWLKTQGSFTLIHAETRTRNNRDFQTNTLGTLNVLESLRLYSPDTVMIYSSTNKVYGYLEQYTYTENDTRAKALERKHNLG